MKQTITPEVRELFRAILTLTSEEECAALFDDLCTVKEMQDLSQRLQVATMLNEQVTGASTATISRVNKCLVYGSGGYRTVLARLDDGQGKE